MVSRFNAEQVIDSIMNDSDEYHDSDVSLVRTALILMEMRAVMMIAMELVEIGGVVRY